jgi:hypothetical protein
VLSCDSAGVVPMPMPSVPSWNLQDGWHGMAGHGLLASGRLLCHCGTTTGLSHAWKPIGNVIFETNSVCSTVRSAPHRHPEFPKPPPHHAHSINEACRGDWLSWLSWLDWGPIPILRSSHRWLIRLRSSISAPLLQTVQSVSVRHHERHR